MDLEVLAAAVCARKCDHPVSTESCVIKADVDLCLGIAAFFAASICTKAAGITMEAAKTAAALVKATCETAFLTAAKHISEDISKNIVSVSAFKVVCMGSGASKTMEAACAGKTTETACKAAVCTESAICPVKTCFCCSGAVKSCVTELVI